MSVDDREGRDAGPRIKSLPTTRQSEADLAQARRWRRASAALAAPVIVGSRGVEPVDPAWTCAVAVGVRVIVLGAAPDRS